MAGRRGARAGRGWDAIPPRPDKDDSPGGDDRSGASRRGNAAGRRRRAVPGEPDGQTARGGRYGAPGGGAIGGAAIGGAAIGGGGAGGRAAARGNAQSESELAREICL